MQIHTLNFRDGSRSSAVRHSTASRIAHFRLVETARNRDKGKPGQESQDL